eukprot:m.142686 g.142686  ORF g.142686 m.142686 type:complete len:151 (-) comp17144_c0_seq9:1330-1782(-)
MSFNVAKHLVPGVGRMTSLVLSKGKGSWVWTDSGRKLLDFTCGIGVTNTGHSHPRVVKRVQEQASKLVHAQANISYHAPLVELVQSLLPVSLYQKQSFVTDMPSSSNGRNHLMWWCDGVVVWWCDGACFVLGTPSRFGPALLWHNRSRGG